MQTHRRFTVNLQDYPDLVMIVLGLEIRNPCALLSMPLIGRGLSQIAASAPDGLLHHQTQRYGWRHLGFRQYWRDFDSLERFTRSAPHAEWWRHFMTRYRGCGFWHETYRMCGGIEAIYADMGKATGLASFAPRCEAIGPLKTSRMRLDASSAVQNDARS